MSLLRVNDIQRATSGSNAVVFTDPVIITTGSISASVITIGTLTSSLLTNNDIPKEKLTLDARDWVNILNKPAGLITSSTQFAQGISGSSIAIADITSSGIIKTTGQFSGSGASLFGIPNAGLVNNSITINGTSVSLGGTRNIVTGDVSESGNLYYTDARVKAKLSAEAVVSSSGQINYQSVTGQPSVNTLGSDGNKSFTISSGIFITASGGADGIVITNDSVNAKLQLRTVGGTVSSSAQVQAALPANLISSSTQVQLLLPGGIVSSSAQYPGWVTGSSQITVQNTTGIGAIATTGSNIFVGNQTISGSTTITGNLTVQGTSSILYVTSSQLDVGSNKLTLNTTTALRYGGLNVYDSGSVTNQSGSLLWDSLNNVWLFVHAGATNTSSILITGPENTGVLGNETFLTANRVPKAGISGDHIVDSQISDNGTSVGITGNLNVTGSITASGISGVSYSTLSNIPTGIVSSSGQINAGATANFATAVAAQLSTVHSGSFLGTATTNNLAEGISNLYYTDARVKTKLNTDVVHSGSFLGTATTTNLAEGTNLYFTNARVLSYVDSLGVYSSSAQVKNNLPAGTVSSSAQISPVLVTSASYAATASLAFGVSGSLAVNTDGLPEGTTNLYYTDTRVKTKLNAENVHSGSFLGTATTTNLTEGTNLYFTNLRVINALPIGTISSSAQLGAGIISSSTQFTTLNAPFTGSFTGSFKGDGSQLTNIGASSLPAGTVSSSAQYPGWVTASSQIDYNLITNKLNGVVSASAQIVPLLPVGTVSQSSGTITVDGTNSIIGINTTSPSTLTKLHVNGALMVENGVTSTNAFKDGIIFTYTGGASQYRHKIVTRHDAVAALNLIEFLVATGASTSESVLTLNGTNPSSFYKGLNVTGSFAVQGSISGALVLPADTVSSSTQVKTFLPASTVSSSTQTVTSLSGQAVTFSGSQFSGIVSGSGTQYRLVIPVGTNLYAT